MSKKGKSASVKCRPAWTVLKVLKAHRTSPSARDEGTMTAQGSPIFHTYSVSSNLVDERTRDVISKPRDSHCAAMAQPWAAKVKVEGMVGVCRSSRHVSAKGNLKRETQAGGTATEIAAKIRHSPCLLHAHRIVWMWENLQRGWRCHGHHLNTAPGLLAIALSLGEFLLNNRRSFAWVISRGSGGPGPSVYAGDGGGTLKVKTAWKG